MEITKGWLPFRQGDTWLSSLGLAWSGRQGNGPSTQGTCSFIHLPGRCLLYVAGAGCRTYVFLSKVNEVLEVNVVPIGLDIVVDEEVELVSNPVLEDEGQDPCCQLQEEDEAKDHGELAWGADRQWGSEIQGLGLPLSGVSTSLILTQGSPESPPSTILVLIYDGKIALFLPTLLSLRSHPPHTTPVSLVPEEPLPYRGLGTHQEPTNQSTTSPGATGIGPEVANQD